jgi:hypothetical protein
MLASSQSVLHRVAVPTPQPLGIRRAPKRFHGEGCSIGRQRAVGSVSLFRAVSIAGAIAGAVQEAIHSQ